MIYFDNAATTKPFQEVLKTYTSAAEKIYGNPSSLHRLGDQATRVLSASRKQVAELLNVKEDEIFFTSSGTESDNWVLKGVAFQKKALGNHIIVSAVEHPAVKESAKWLSKQGFEIDYAPVDKKGFVDVKKLKKLIRPETILISIMAVNNEIGSIQPIQEISTILENRPNITFHVDAVQAIGKIPTKNYITSRVDFASFSAHKFHGLRGVGITYIKTGKKINPLLSGGGQEKALRSSTENVAGIVASAKALRLTMTDMEIKNKKLQKMKSTIIEALKTYPDITLFSKLDRFSPHIITFGINGVRGEVVVHAFEEKEIYISTTSACSSKAGKPAGTLVAMGVPMSLATTAVRLSLDDDNNMGEIEQFLTLLKSIYQQTKKVR